MGKSIAILVLGDVGRSPRMQYHTLSLSQLPDTEVRSAPWATTSHDTGAGNKANGTINFVVLELQVSLVGYAGERCIEAVENSSNVKQYLLGSPFAKLPRSLFLLWAPFKVLYQVRIC